MLKGKRRIILLFIVLFLLTGVSVVRGYSPEISGNYERGERSYIDVFFSAEEEYDEELDDIEEFMEEELAEELIDKYYYDRIWLRYRQQLNKSDYYYVKIQYYTKEYQERLTFNNITWDLWTNYTFRLTEQLRNKIMVDLRQKDYYDNEKNTYNQLRFKYQLDFDIDERNDCSLFLQRQWKDYPNNEAKDNLYDRFSISWNYKVSSKLKVSTGLVFDRNSFKPISESSNKESRKFSIGFNWKL